MSRYTYAGLAAAMLLAAWQPQAGAADFEPMPTADEWTFTVAPYFWAAGMSGDVGIFGLEPVELNLKFRDILKDLKFAAMGVAELHNGRWGIAGDIMYSNIGTDESVQRIVGGVDAKLDASVGTQTFTGTIMGEYRVIDQERMMLDVMAGIRIWDVNTDIDMELKANGNHVGTFSGNDGATWVDPMIGVKTRLDTGSPIFFTAWGLVGGVVTGSDFGWDLLGGIGYQWTEKFSTVAGYRALGVDYESDGFVFDVVQQGIIIGGVFEF